MDNAQDNKDKTPGTVEAGEDVNTECPMCSLEVSVNENALMCDQCQEWVHIACDPSVSKELYLEHLKNEALEFLSPGCSLRRYENNDERAPTNVYPGVQRPREKSQHPHRQPTDISTAPAQTDENETDSTTVSANPNTQITVITLGPTRDAPTNENKSPMWSPGIRR